MLKRIIKFNILLLFYKLYKCKHIQIFHFLGEDNENSGNEIWLSCSNEKLDRLAFSNTNWFHYRSTNVSPKITALCTIDDHSVWLGDAEGQIYAYL